MNYEDEELKLVDYQLIVSGTIAVVIITSLVLGYNLHLKLSGQKPFLSDKEVRDISMFIKILALIAALSAVYISIKSIELLNEKGESPTNAYLELAASLLAALTAILLIIVVYRNNSEYFLDIENPEV